MVRHLRFIVSAEGPYSGHDFHVYRQGCYIQLCVTYCETPQVSMINDTILTRKVKETIVNDLRRR